MPAGAGTLGAVRRVPLDRAGARWALLREPGGLDEEGVAGRGTLEAIRLLDRLLVEQADSCVRPGEAASLTLPERDLLLAAAWRLAHGPTIAGTLTCTACRAPFDFDFNLDDLVEQVRASTGKIEAQGGVYALPNGCRFRLPTGNDERALAGLPEAVAESTLLARCIIEGDPARDGPEILAAMEQVGSGVDVDVAATCSECGHSQAVRFQIQDYLLGALAGEWSGLVEEVHRLALAYRWSLHEILALPRSRRRAFVTLLSGDSLPRVRDVS